MLRFVLIVTALAAASAAPAADMSAGMASHSRLGAVFADPAPPRRGAALPPRPIEEPIVSYAPEVDIPPLVNGYYGKPNAYYYRNYYGTRPETIFSRAPYGCGFYGYC